MFTLEGFREVNHWMGENTWSWLPRRGTQARSRAFVGRRRMFGFSTAHSPYLCITDIRCWRGGPPVVHKTASGSVQLVRTPDQRELEGGPDPLNLREIAFPPGTGGGTGETEVCIKPGGQDSNRSGEWVRGLDVRGEVIRDAHLHV